MIVHRAVYQSKSLREGDMLDAVKRVLAHAPWPGGGTRVYRNHTGPFNRIAIEFEAESLSAFEEAWNNWTAVAFTDESTQAWSEVDAGGGGTEFWTLE